MNAPGDVFGSAAFVGAHEVEVRAGNGDPCTTAFDPGSLRADVTWSRGCAAG